MPEKTWDELLVDDRKKLGTESADPQNHSEWRRCTPPPGLVKPIVPAVFSDLYKTYR